MFEKLKEGIRRFSRLSLATKEEVENLIKDLQRELLRSDVDVELVFELTKEIKKDALKKDIPKGLTRKEYVLNLVYNKLIEFLGQKQEISLEKGTILLCGLFGSGKTTTTGKLANFYRKRGHKVGVISCDIYRAGAYEQLKQLSEKSGVEFYGERNSKNAIKTIKNGLKELKNKKCDIIIIDSAGRDSMSSDLVKEIKEISEKIKPDEKYLVVPSDLGQTSAEQAKFFDSAIGLTGVIVTKTDSSAKAGGVFSSCFHAKVPVIFVGTGEKISDFEIYDPVPFVSKMLGFPNLKSLLEKAKENFDEKKAKKILEGTFSLEEFYEQISNAKKAGIISQIKNMLPVGVKIPENALEVQEENIEKFKYIIDSMTPEERANPDIINRSRIARIAEGSGNSEKTVRELIKTYRQVRNMMGKMSGKNLRRGPMKKLLKQFRIN